jgi:hypothetical protein
MSVELNIGIDVAALDAARADLGELADQLPTVLSRAVNKVGTATRGKVVDAVTEEMNLPAAQIKSRNTDLTQASPDNPEATLTISGRRIPLSYFEPEEAAGGVSYEVRRGQRVTYARSFMATMKSGHEGVYRRRTAGQARRDYQESVDELNRITSSEANLILPPRRLSARRQAMRDAHIGRLKHEAARFQETEGLTDEQLVDRLPINEPRGPSVPEVAQNIPALSQETLDEQVSWDLADEVNQQVGVIIARRRMQ